MQRGPAQVALVVREGLLHERHQRRNQGGARRDQGPAHGLRESALIAAEVLDEPCGEAGPVASGSAGWLEWSTTSSSIACDVHNAAPWRGPRLGQPMDITGLSPSASSKTP